jgi:hypothetical protein
VTWPIHEFNKDLFEVVSEKGEKDNGWLISGGSKGQESIEVATTAPLIAEGTWFWISMKDWIERWRGTENRLAVIIGSKKIIFNGEKPSIKPVAEAIFWESTGLKDQQWFLGWPPTKVFVARLLRKEKAQARQPTPLQLSLSLIDTPRKLPNSIKCPESQDFTLFFERQTQIPIKHVKLQYKNEVISPNSIPPGEEIQIQYLLHQRLRHAGPIVIYWPDEIETWWISKEKLKEELDWITTKKGYSLQDGYLGPANSLERQGWPQDGKLYWKHRSDKPSGIGRTQFTPPPGFDLPPSVTTRKIPKTKRYKSADPDYSTTKRRKEYTRRNKKIVSSSSDSNEEEFFAESQQATISEDHPNHSEKDTTPPEWTVKCGEEPLLMHSEQEVRDWIHENRRWKITRNLYNWEGGKIMNGDHFRLKDGIQQEKEVLCIDPDGHEYGYSQELARDWANRFKHCVLTRNDTLWNGEELDPGDVLEARIRTVPRGIGRGKTCRKGIPIYDPQPEDKPYTVGPLKEAYSRDELMEWLKNNEGWVISRNGDPWNYQTIEPGDHFQFPREERELRAISCSDDEGTQNLNEAQTWAWLANRANRNILRNNQPWDNIKVLPGDKFEARSRKKGGAGPAKSRDIFSVRNYSPRMARRKKIEAAARELREKQRAEEELEESIRWKATEITYEGQEFITRDFVNVEWNKYTARRFARWVQSFSGLPRERQRIIDMGSGKEFTEIQGKSLALLNDDEVWENGQIMLRRKKTNKFPWRGIRTSPVRVLLRIRDGCIWKCEEATTFKGRVVRLVKKGDARKSISLFEKDHQGIRVQPCWLGISSPRLHMGETPSRKGWWQRYWIQRFIEQAGRLKSGLDYTKVESPSDIIEWPVPEPKTTRVTIRYQNLKTVREFRRGFEGERIIDWAEKTWGVSSEMTAITMNGVDWTPSNYLPQDCIIDFVPRFRESLDDQETAQEPAANEVQVFVNILDQERVWRLKLDNDWYVFKAIVDAMADEWNWFATFNGQIWVDGSRCPEKKTKIMVVFDLPGGSPKVKLPVAHVTVRIQDRDPFPLTIVQNKEWGNFQKCINLILTGWSWTATLRGQPWTNDDRVPIEGDEIQITFAKCGPILKTVQGFVKVGAEASQIVHLHEGREWEHFNEWMKVHKPMDKWAAFLNGHPWEDDSLAPKRDQTIRVNITAQGGGKTKLQTMKIWVKIGKAPKKQIDIVKKKEDCWEDFRSKVSREVGDMWFARIFGPGHKDNGKKWKGVDIKPNENDTVAVSLPHEPVVRHDLDDLPAPIFARIVPRDKEDPIELRPIELKDLKDVLPYAPPPPDWAITRAEKQANFEVLSILETMSKWPDPKFAGRFIRNAIAASRIGSKNHRPDSDPWIPLQEESPVFDLLIQLPL